MKEYGLKAVPLKHERMNEWRDSLKRKARHWPELYQFDDRFYRQRMRELTTELITRYTDFGSLEAYLDGYSIHGDRLAPLAVPATILTSADDPRGTCSRRPRGPCGAIGPSEKTPSF